MPAIIGQKLASFSIASYWYLFPLASGLHALELENPRGLNIIVTKDFGDKGWLRICVVTTRRWSRFMAEEITGIMVVIKGLSGTESILSGLSSGIQIYISTQWHCIRLC